MGTVEVRLFGAPEILSEGRAVPIETRKAIAVLAVLAVEGRPVRRDRLAGMLWPEVTQERARSNLRRTLSALRGAIGTEALGGDRESLSFDTPVGVVDVVDFSTLVEEGSASALELYRGPFLEGFSVPDAPEFEDWQRGEADRFARRVDALLERLAERSDPRAGLGFAKRRLELDPLNESAARQAMVLAGSVGDRASAVAVYRDLVRTLSDDLGVEPLADTTAVYEAARRGRHGPGADSGLQVEPGRSAEAGPRESVERVASPGAPFVGRSDDLADLDATVRDHGLILVTGEPGVGRTRFVEEWVADQDRALLVRCHRGERDIPYAPLSAWLPDESATSRVRLFEELADGIPTEPGGVLVLDDLDLADSGTLEFLTYVLHRPDRFGWTVVATWRSATVSPDDAVWDLLSEGRRAGWASELALGRLDRESVEQIVRSVGGIESTTASRLAERADGLPFVAVELARFDAGSDSIPQAVEDLMATMLGGASPVALQAVEALAVVGRPLEDRLLRTIAGRSDDEMGLALVELQADGMVRCGPGIELTHQLLGEVALAGLPAARLRALHGRAAEVLPPSEAARHMTAAGRPREAFELHRRAAQEARDAYANRAAVDHLRAALELSGDDSATLLREIGDLEVLNGMYDSARRAYEVSAAHAYGVELIGVELALARLALRSRDVALAMSHIESAGAEIESAADVPPSLAVEVALTGALAQAEAGGPVDGIDSIVQAARASGSGELEASAEAAVAFVCHRASELEAAGEHARRAGRLAQMADAPLVEAAAANIMGLSRSESGDLEGALEALDRSRVILSLHGDVHRLAAVHANLADNLHALGRSDAARAHQIESARLFSEVSGSPLEGRADLWFLTAW